MTDARRTMVQGAIILVLAGCGGSQPPAPASNKVVVTFDDKPPIAAAGAADWKKAGRSFEAPHAAISIESAVVGPLKLVAITKVGEKMEETVKEMPGEASLQLVIEITNRSADRKLEIGKLRPELVDEIGNHYTGAPQPTTSIADVTVKAVGQDMPSTSLYPGKSARDVFVFQKPVSAAKELRLSIPGDPFGQAAPIRLKVPAPAEEAK